MVPPAPAARRTLKRTSRVIRDRRSFRNLSRIADQLEQVSAHSATSPDAIASHFLTKKQEDVETRLHEQQEQTHLHRFVSHHLIDLLRRSADCSWRASLLGGVLFRNILDAKRSIDDIQRILNSPSCHSQVDQLHLALEDLHRLFSDDTLDEIRHKKDLLANLVKDLQHHRERIRVRALSRISFLKRRMKDGVLPVLRHLKASLKSKLCMYGTPLSPDGSHSERRGLSLGKDCTDEDCDNGADAGIDKVEDDCNVLSFGSQSSQLSTITSMNMVHKRLHYIERSMFCASRTLETLMPLVLGTRNQGLSQHLIELLREDPLMFDGVAAQIAGSNESLSSHLGVVREHILECFSYINRARDHAYEI